MRLTKAEIAAIKESAHEAFGESVVVRLFGSRVHGHLRGGDIDLHFQVADGQQDVAHAARFRWQLFGRIDERKVDLVFQVPNRPVRPIDVVALADGIVL